MGTTFLQRPLQAAILAVLATGATLAAADASAATQRTTYRTATATCVGPLPEFDQQLRKSPIGIKNDGTDSAFISCSLPADFVGDLTAGMVEVLFTNFGAAPATVDCTLVAGNRIGGFGSVAGSATINPGVSGFVIWSGIYKSHQWGSYNFSCILPPGVEMNTGIDQNNDPDDGL